MIPISDADAVAQAITDIVATAGTLTHIAEAVPAGLKPTPANPDLRREAYLEFQGESWRAFSQSQLFIELARITERPLYKGRPRDSFGRVLTALEASHETLSALLAAMSRVRMVGNPEPRAAGERLVMMLGKLHENLGVVGSDRERAKQRAEYVMWQKRFGQAQKEFTEICRKDLEFTRLVRDRKWKVWRPVAPEPWPGGWPGVLDEDAGVEVSTK